MGAMQNKANIYYMKKMADKKRKQKEATCTNCGTKIPVDEEGVATSSKGLVRIGFEVLCMDCFKTKYT